MKAYHLIYLMIGLIVFGSIIALHDHDLKYSQEITSHISSSVK